MKRFMAAVNRSRRAVKRFMAAHPLAGAHARPHRRDRRARPRAVTLHDIVFGGHETLHGPSVNRSWPAMKRFMLDEPYMNSGIF